MDEPKNMQTLKELSEKSGIEMIVIDEAQKITKTTATRFLRMFIGSSYAVDPIQSFIRQKFPNKKTVELPGISFFVENAKAKELVGELNDKFAYRNNFAFISDRNGEDDKKQTISIIHSSDKYNAIRLQETSGGSNFFSTDNLIEKLKRFEEKYPFTFIGVGDDWILLELKENVTDWQDLAKEVLIICPNDETSIEDFANVLQNGHREIFMWWD